MFGRINGVEEVLGKDPANVYKKMDYKTKDYYRNAVKEISDETRISEIYVANKALELAVGAHDCVHNKHNHIGYYLISDGVHELKEVLTGKKDRLIENNNDNKVRDYIWGNIVLTALLAIIVGVYVGITLNNPIIGVVLTALVYIPISEICMQTINYILGKKVKPTHIPKMDFSKGVPESSATCVIIPTILNSEDKVRELARKLEVYYLANKSENIYFTILGDCTESKDEITQLDGKITTLGLEEIEKLNSKYTGCEGEEKIFHFLYRSRKWSSGEQSYIGWERKRGLICEFNKFLTKKEDAFKINTMAEGVIPKIKYVITLDADTNLVLDSAFELIGASSHILNRPIVDPNKKIVIDGYGIIQPRIGTDLVSNRKSLFAKIFSEEGGTDVYANAISDVYQDNFGEGIFTGKGIYDVEVFEEVLAKRIPENTVLSHDLLEGNYLRCGLATDILLLDSSPAKYSSYMNRFSRWTRGDWQIAGWLRRKVKTSEGVAKNAEQTNPLSSLSKFKILDNLRRSLIPLFAVLLMISAVGAAFGYPLFGGTNEYSPLLQWMIILIALIALTIPTILNILNIIIFKKDTNFSVVNAHRNIMPTMSGIKASFIRAILEVLFLPNKTYVTLVSIIKAIYRTCGSKRKVLEWMTSEEAEKQSKTNLASYFTGMWTNVLFGVLFIAVGVGFHAYPGRILFAPTNIDHSSRYRMACSTSICVSYKQREKRNTSSRAN